MQTLPQLLRLLSLEWIIDSKLLMLVPEIARLDAMSTTGYAYALMETQGKDILAYSPSQIAECSTKDDMVMIVAS